MNYYGRFYKSALTPVLRELERSPAYWVRRKFKRFTRHARRAVHWLATLPAGNQTCLCSGKSEFGLRPDNKSWMGREVHVRFCEGLGVRFPRATRLLLGFSGPREEAEGIKLQLRQFLEDDLKLELSKHKTLITNARTGAARFLGYEIVTLDANHKHDRRGHRCINGHPGLKVPADVIRNQCARYMRRGRPSHRPERINDSAFSIVTQY